MKTPSILREIVDSQLQSYDGTDQGFLPEDITNHILANHSEEVDEIFAAHKRSIINRLVKEMVGRTAWTAPEDKRQMHFESFDLPPIISFPSADGSKQSRFIQTKKAKARHLDGAGSLRASHAEFNAKVAKECYAARDFCLQFGDEVTLELAVQFSLTAKAA